jgi:hypothetical protein
VITLDVSEAGDPSEWVVFLGERTRAARRSHFRN